MYLSFLDAFGFGADVEVEVAGEPEVRVVADEVLGGFLFEDFEGGAKWVVEGFGEEEVDVLGHEDVAVEVEGVGLAEVFEVLLDYGLCVRGGEEGEAVVAAEGDEVELVGLLVALEA